MTAAWRSPKKGKSIICIMQTTSKRAKQNPGNRKETLLLGLLALLLTVPSLFLCANNHFWMDEFFSIRHAASGWAELMRWIPGDVHPPLYYMMLKAVVDLFGDAPAVLKGFSVCAYFLLLWAGGCFALRTSGRPAALLLMGFLWCQPNLFYYSVEVRMYTWAMLFVTLSAAAAGRLMRGIEAKEGAQDPVKDWIVFTLSTLAAAYTHYYALLAAGGEVCLLAVAALLWKNRRFGKRLGISAAAMALGYLPWLPFFLRQALGVSKDYWIALESPASVLGQLLRVHTPRLRNSLLYLLLLAAALLIWNRKREEKPMWFWRMGNLAVFALVLGACYAVSLLRQPILLTRYLQIVFVLVPLSLCAAGQYFPRKVSGGILGLLLVWFLYAGVCEYREAWEIQYPPVAESLALLENEMEPGAVVYSDLPGARLYLDYYEPGRWDLRETDDPAEAVRSGKACYVLTQKEPDEDGMRGLTELGQGRLKLFPFRLYRCGGET